MHTSYRIIIVGAGAYSDGKLALSVEIGGFLAVGDGAWVSRGLLQASASGVLAARGILQRIGGD